MDSIDIKNRQIEKQILIDSQIVKYDKQVHLVFNKDITIFQIYIKEFILNHLETKIDLNQIKFLVLRIPELSQDSNNVIYNTSAFNPDTDIILYKTCCYPENYHFESKMMFAVDNFLNTRDLHIQVLDDQAQFLTKNELGPFFLDMKIVIANSILK